MMAEATQVGKITEHINREKKCNNKILDDGKDKESSTFIFKKQVSRF